MENINVKSFVNKILAGVALGIVVGLIPNAILGELFKFLSQYHDIFATLNSVVVGIQFTVPVIVGVLIAMQFKMNSIQTVIVGTASFVGSGAASFQGNIWILTGIGDLINTMITASIAVLIIMLIQDKLKSLTIILLPIIAGGIAGFIGIILLPYVQLITDGIGQVINSFTTLQPLLMYILIAIAFSIIIVSPISTVAIAMAIGISGLAAGAANIGIAAAACMLVIGTFKVNNSGVPIAIFLGAMKMMMPNLLKNPIIAVPIGLTAAVTGFVASFVGIEGTKESAGFGFSGLVGPINAVKFMDGSILVNIGMLILVYFIVPFIAAYVIHHLCTRVLKLYDPSVFKFISEESGE
ncbi:PTS transporter subunit IIC [Bacillaceae bacterium SIJ1]|uniref:PTS transporter subunit IIC n=1 Tax=Litoribacterium kuwaitense TaxID=1398745 RepID=UPI0013EABAB8|nr:PTS sugar transporter subunit IIC [Litoribacterium kuwaitense]NGP45875.1 PTS transporter subunit IIC [Litoribacterium kuwaitense]